jgi:flagellar biosynthesis regulator FlaF
MPLDEDRNAIVEVLQFTEKLFDLLIKRLASDDHQLFQDAWDETKPILQQQISLLRSIQSEGDKVWTAIREVGLTGKNLVMKIHYLAKAASGDGPKSCLIFSVSWQPGCWHSRSRTDKGGKGMAGRSNCR